MLVTAARQTQLLVLLILRGAKLMESHLPGNSVGIAIPSNPPWREAAVAGGVSEGLW